MIHAREFEPYSQPALGSLLAITATQEYLLQPAELLMAALATVLEDAVPGMFRIQGPHDEADFNAKIGALLRTHVRDLRSEYPSASFACAGYVPDHIVVGSYVAVESKYIRAGTSPSKAREGIAADLCIRNPQMYTLFVVFDPQRQIKDDVIFREDLESKGRCRVCILR